MDIVRCEGCGKHFDIETYPVCPTCGGKAAGSINQEPSGFGWFKRNKNKGKDIIKKKEIPAEHVDDIDNKDDKKSGIDPGSLHLGPENAGSDNGYRGNTISMWDKKLDQIQHKGEVPIDRQDVRSEEDEEIVLDEQDYDYGDGSYDEMPAEEHRYDDEPIRERSITKPVESKSLSEEIGSLSASSGSKTLSFFDATMSKKWKENPAVLKDEDRDTKEKQYTNYGMPVTGWLVCIEGEHIGKSFEVHMGKNSIGRGEANDIRLSDDMAVSRDTQADIVYEPKKRNFFVVPRSDGNNLVYLNEEYITGRSLLNDRDILEVGSSKLMFVRLCGDDFAWEDIIRE